MKTFAIYEKHIEKTLIKLQKVDLSETLKFSLIKSVLKRLQIARSLPKFG
jgi:hypothetical protein